MLEIGDIKCLQSSMVESVLLILTLTEHIKCMDVLRTVLVMALAVHGHKMSIRLSATKVSSLVCELVVYEIQNWNLIALALEKNVYLCILSADQ